MPVFIPNPPVGVKRCTESPASNTRPEPNFSATKAGDHRALEAGLLFGHFALVANAELASDKACTTVATYQVLTFQLSGLLGRDVDDIDKNSFVRFGPVGTPPTERKLMICLCRTLAACGKRERTAMPNYQFKIQIQI